MRQELLHLIEQSIDGKRLKTAKEKCHEALTSCVDNEERIIVTYNTGALYWSLIGDGEEARKYYLWVLDLCANNQAADSRQIRSQLEANACENMMILSMSYEEYDEWTGKLRKMNPQADILAGQVPHVEKERENGRPWSYIMQVFAQTYYNRNDPKLDVGMYGNAASIYHLLLKNRRALRVSREDLHSITYEYGALKLRMASDSMRMMEKSGSPIDPDECMFILEDPKLYIDEYLAANPADETIQFLSNNINSFINSTDEIREYEISRQQQPKYVINASDLTCRRCGFMNFNTSQPCPRCGYMKTEGIPEPFGGMMQPQAAPNPFSCLLYVILALGPAVFLAGKLFRWW